MSHTHNWLRFKRDEDDPEPDELALCNIAIKFEESLERIREIADVMIGNGPGAVNAYYTRGRGLPTMYRHLVEHAKEIRQEVNAVLGDRG